MQLYLIRHGESIGNAEGRFQGQQDFPLSQTGLEQARCLAARMLGLEQPPGTIFTSDLTRARLTASLVGQALGVPVRPLPEAREYGFGLLEGLTPQEFRDRYPEHAGSPGSDLTALQIPGEEDRRAFAGRVGRLISRLRTESVGTSTNGGPIALVSHGRYLNGFMVVFLGLDLELPWPFRFGNCSLSLVEQSADGRPIVRFLNDCSHLEGRAAPSPGVRQLY